MLTIIYGLLLLAAGSNSNLIVVLVSLEILSWIFVTLMTFYTAFKYLVVQSIFLLVTLTSFILGITWLFQWALIIKLGVPPLHLWILSLISSLWSSSAAFLLTIHKMLPLAVLGKTLVVLNSWFVIVLLLLSSLGLYLQTNIVAVLFFSSITHTLWSLLAFSVSLSFFLLYWCLYSILVMILFAEFSGWLNSVSFNLSSSLNLVLLILSGVPPFLVFWLKLNLFSWIFMKALAIALFIILLAVLAVVTYFRVIHTSLSLNNWLSPHWNTSLVATLTLFSLLLY